MKIFIDTLDLEQIKKYNNMGILSGVTTNPTMAKKFGVTDDLQMVLTLREIIGNKEIHVEAFGDTADEILHNTDRLLGTGKNLVFKIPFSQQGVFAASRLIDMGYKTSLHLVYSINQALIAMAVKSTYICPLVGRLDDVGHRALGYIEYIIKAKNYPRLNETTKIMVSSVRHPQHVMGAWRIGADAITIPPYVLEQLFYHPLTETGINTFREDIESMKHACSKIK